MRFFLNLFGGVLLAVALVFATADIARSLADGVLSLTGIGEGFAAVGLPLGPEPGPPPNVVDLVASVMAWPASIAFGCAAFVFLFVGRPPHRRSRLAR